MYTEPFKILTENENQISQWDNHYLKNNGAFGKSPSQSAIYAAEIFSKNNVKHILELGAGQGRDTIFFALNGFNIQVIEYSKVAIRDLETKIKHLNLEDKIEIIYHDLRKPLPFPKNYFDACYSHMLFCMEFKEDEIIRLNKEIHRIISQYGYNCFTVRNENDKEFGIGKDLGNMIYESGGFIVHYFDQNKINRISKLFKIIDISEFHEGRLPRSLYRVLLKKS